VAVSSPDQALAAARAKEAKTRAAQVVSTDPTTATGEFTDFLKTVAKNPALITGYSKILKAAGYYNGKITSKYNAALAKAFIDAEKDRALVAQANPISREDFYAQLEPTGTGTAGGPTVVTDITAYTPEAARMLIQSVIKDTLGRNATDSEIKKYTSGLKKIQQQAASTTTYKTVGGKQVRTTTPGINEQQYLIDQIAGTDEGKANKALGFYETFMNALGGR
jgi:hypothetical protein